MDMILYKNEIIKLISRLQHHAYMYIRFSLTGPLTFRVGSCQLNSCLIRSKFVSEFVGTDKPTKFVSCRFMSVELSLN